MLTSLEIQNYALIERLQMQFAPSFTVVTGETGAGKSIMLGALGLLLGQRADAKSIRKGAAKCVVEGTFDLSGHRMQPLFDEYDLEYDERECTLRREITATGKSRAFVNDTPVTLAQIKEIASRLIDIHSQHQNLLIGREDFQLSVLDTLADDAPLLEECRAAHRDFKAAARRLEQLQEQLHRQQGEEEYLRFQLTQLQEAALANENEQEELEQEMALMEHTEEIKSALQRVTSALDADEESLLHTLGESRRTLQAIAPHYPPADELARRVESCYIELKDLCREAERGEEQIEFDPERLQQLNDRLNLIYSLQQKHHCQSVAQLIELRNTIEAQMAEIDNSDEHLAQLTRQLEKCRVRLTEVATRLTRSRAKAIPAFERKVKESLLRLGMPNVRFSVLMEEKSCDANGCDRVTLLFSANKNAAMQPLSQIASGGEIARVMFSIKALVARAVLLPTVVFDEVDTGLSGGVAQSMGLLMREMGDLDGRQVICITHLPQIAALGRSHFKVYKHDVEEETQTDIVPLSGEERLREVARLMSGERVTEAALDNARALMNEKS